MVEQLAILCEQMVILCEHAVISFDQLVNIIKNC
jgi:hypothetical protein